VVLAVSEAGAEAMKREAAVLNFVRDAYAHLKIIGFTASSMPLLEMAGIDIDDGVIELDSGGATAYIDVAKKGRLWPRAAVIKA
jgi:catalase